MPHNIIAVADGSPACRAGMRAGDALISIDGEAVRDFIDYQALCAHSRLDIQTRAGKFHVKKGQYEDLGLEFETPMMSNVKRCVNACGFCFVDQLPAYARESLRLKDDDWRMSLMMGNYVSLTNVSDSELDRMIRRHASPLYISVHAMNPELRADIMGAPRAAKLPEQLTRLKEGGISFHAQAVLCPGLNDGEELERTIAELFALRPNALSLALVPIGLTEHREGLKKLKKYDAAGARDVLAIADKWRAKCLAESGSRFVFPSDEFYIAAGTELPEGEEYEDYQQIDDGVGMLRLFYDEYSDAWKRAELAPSDLERRVILACGASAADFFRRLLSEYPVPGAMVDVVAVPNKFFGESVTVSGLLTGGDILSALKGGNCGIILVSKTMLREGEDVFLDGMTLSELESALGARVIPVARGGDDLFTVIKDSAEGKNG